MLRALGPPADRFREALRAQLGERAAFAAGRACKADVPAVQHQSVADAYPVFLRIERHQVAFNLLRVLLFGQLEPSADARAVHVDDHAFRAAERFAQHDVGGLSRDPGQFDELGERFWDPAAVFFDQLTAGRLNGLGLVAKKSRRVDQRFDLRRVCAGEGGGAAKALEKISTDPVNRLVGTLSGQDRGHQQLPRVIEVQLDDRFGQRLRESLPDASRAFFQVGVYYLILHSAVETQGRQSSRFLLSTCRIHKRHGSLDPRLINGGYVVILTDFRSNVAGTVSWTTPRSTEGRISSTLRRRKAVASPKWTRREVTRALRAGNERELHRLTEHLLPVVHARVARVLLSCSLPDVHLRGEVEDLTQEVFAHLFDNDARILRTWNPARGASLRNYVGLVAERRVRSLLRSGRWTRWREQPTAAGDLETHASPVESPAQRTAEQQYWERVIFCARQRLSEQGLRMMELLLIQERSIAEVAEATGMTAASLYAWRSRLQKLMRELARDLRLADGLSVTS